MGFSADSSVLRQMGFLIRLFKTVLMRLSSCSAKSNPKTRKNGRRKTDPQTRSGKNGGFALLCAKKMKRGDRLRVPASGQNRPLRFAGKD